MDFLKISVYLKEFFAKYCCFCYKYYQRVSGKNSKTSLNKNTEKCLLESLNDIKHDYLIDENDLINYGHYSVVYKSYCPERSKEVAIKKIEGGNLTKAKLNKIIDEIRIFKSVIHPNINQYYDAYLKNNNIFIVQEYCRGDDLLNYMNIKNGIFTEEEAKQIIRHIVLAVQHCHQSDIIHRDIKPENIIFLTEDKDPTKLKLIDFGLAIAYKPFERHTPLSAKVGTHKYIAPEVIRGNYTYKCDIWSIGVIMYILLFGEFPFKGENTRLLNNIVRLNYQINNKDKKISEEALHLLSNILIREKSRFNFTRILDHKWFLND